jgi:hypothetical protein
MYLIGTYHDYDLYLDPHMSWINDIILLRNNNKIILTIKIVDEKKILIKKK